VPILDVVTGHDEAVALYEAAEWKRLGTVEFRFPDGAAINEYVYCAPNYVLNPR
jgi:hypothetical protein